MASSDSQIDKPQRGRPKRAELPDVNINTGAQNINTEKASLIQEGLTVEPLATMKWQKLRCPRAEIVPKILTLILLTCRKENIKWYN